MAIRRRRLIQLGNGFRARLIVGLLRAVEATPCTFGAPGCSGQPVAPDCNFPNVWQGGACVPGNLPHGGGGKTGTGVGVNTSPCPNEMTGPNCTIFEEGVCAGETELQCYPPKPVCNRQCQIDGAQGQANDASTALWVLTAIIGGSGTIIGGIAGLLITTGSAAIATIAGIPLGIAEVALGNLLAGLAISLAVIGTELGILAALFGGQAGQASSKWSMGSIESFQGEVDQVIGTFSIIQSVMAVVGLAMGTPTAAMAAGVQGLGFALGNAMGMLTATAGIGNWADSILGNEESALNCTVATSDGTNSCV